VNPETNPYIPAAGSRPPALVGRERLDRRVREPKDLEAVYGLPLLGVVPENSALSRSAKGRKNAGAPLPASEAEAFHLIRAHLRYFNVDRDGGHDAAHVRDYGLQGSMVVIEPDRIRGNQAVQLGWWLPSRACLPDFTCLDTEVVIPRKRFDRCWWSLVDQPAREEDFLWAGWSKAVGAAHVAVELGDGERGQSVAGGVEQSLLDQA
jgi:hypothetical protein